MTPQEEARMELYNFFKEKYGDEQFTVKIPDHKAIDLFYRYSGALWTLVLLLIQVSSLLISYPESVAAAATLIITTWAAIHTIVSISFHSLVLSQELEINGTYYAMTDSVTVEAGWLKPIRNGLSLKDLQWYTDRAYKKHTKAKSVEVSRLRRIVLETKTAPTQIDSSKQILALTDRIAELEAQKTAKEVENKAMRDAISEVETISRGI